MQDVIVASSSCYTIRMFCHSHDARVARIAQQVAAFYCTRKSFRIYHGSTNSTRILSFKKSEVVDVSSLNRILSINTKNHTALVEPNVPMDKLVHTTLKHGLVPPVIPEFPGITVGGGIQGGAGESSSFKWGFLSQTTRDVEYILGDGTVRRASPTKDSDLFYGAAGSCGSLGVITAATLQLISAKRYVVVNYHPVTSFEECVAFVEHESAASTYDFIDAIMFSSHAGVVVCGTLSDTKQGKLQRFSRARDQWYYLHIEAICTSGATPTESILLQDYLFRYNRGAFWVGKFAFELFGVPFTRFYRFVLNPILNTRKLYQALQVSGASQEYIVQDLTVPIERGNDLLQYIDETLGVYPLWVCPVKSAPRSPLLCNGFDSDMSLNIGVWGPRIVDHENFVATNKAIEHKLMKLGGKKWMYAHTYYTESEFWRIYDKRWYTALRTAYRATTLPTMYEKVVVKKHYPVNTKRGLFRTIFGLAKLRIRD